MLREAGDAFLEVFDARLVDGLEFGLAERRVGALATKWDKLYMHDTKTKLSRGKYL